MSTAISETNQSIICNMMMTSKAIDIAILLSLDKDLVSAFIKEAAGEKGILTKDAKHSMVNARYNARKAKQPVPAVKDLSKRKQQRLADQHRKDQEKLAARIARNKQKEAEGKYIRRPPNYKTIEVDYTKLVSVRIDRTTTIYAKPGEEAKTKAAFMKLYKRPIDQYK